MSDIVIVTINIAPSLEESMVDCLLEFDRGLGFTSMPVGAHDHNNQDLTSAEQVTGRQRKIGFQLLIEAADLPELLAKLHQEFTGTKLRYWVTPVLSGGVI